MWSWWMWGVGERRGLTVYSKDSDLEANPWRAKLEKLVFLSAPTLCNDIEQAAPLVSLVPPDLQHALRKNQDTQATAKPCSNHISLSTSAFLASAQCQYVCCVVVYYVVILAQCPFWLLNHLRLFCLNALTHPNLWMAEFELVECRVYKFRMEGSM